MSKATLKRKELIRIIYGRRAWGLEESLSIALPGGAYGEIIFGN